MAGKLIAIEGLDGSGKATQTKNLFDYLVKNGERCSNCYFSWITTVLHQQLLKCILIPGVW